MELFSGGLLAVGIAGAVAYWKPLRAHWAEGVRKFRAAYPEHTFETIRESVSESVRASVQSASAGRSGTKLWDRFTIGMSRDDVRRVLLGKVQSRTDANGQEELRGEPVRVEDRMAVPNFCFTSDKLDRIYLEFVPSAGDEQRLGDAFNRIASMLRTRYGEPSYASRESWPWTSVWRADGRVVELTAHEKAAVRQHAETASQTSPSAAAASTARHTGDFPRLAISYVRDGSATL